MSENTSKPDWSRATVKVRVPVIHTAMETVEEIEVPVEILRRGQFDGMRELTVVTEEQYERIVRMLRADPAEGAGDFDAEYFASEADQLAGKPLADPAEGERMAAPEGSEPEGPGLGKPWIPQVGVTFIAAGAFVRSLIDLTTGQEGQGLVGMDVTGKWNHAAKDTLSIITHPDVADQWGRFLVEAAAAARLDQARASDGTNRG